jgi:hypothetical protein
VCTACTAISHCTSALTCNKRVLAGRHATGYALAQ